MKVWKEDTAKWHRQKQIIEAIPQEFSHLKYPEPKKPKQKVAGMPFPFH